MRLLPATVLLSLALPACQSSPAFIAHGCLAITDRATCMVSPEASAPFQSTGTIDAAYAGQYTCDVLLEDTSLPSSVQVVNAQVQVIDDATQSVLGEFTAPTSATLSSSTPFGVATVTLLDAARVQMLAQKVLTTEVRQLVVAHFWMEGRTPGGDQVSAPPIDFPIDVMFASSCVSPPGEACWGPDATPVTDCALGIDEPAGTSCQAIASTVGLCGLLECDVDPMTGKSDLTSARCPSQIPADQSCCDP